MNCIPAFPTHYKVDPGAAWAVSNGVMVSKHFLGFVSCSRSRGLKTYGLVVGGERQGLFQCFARAIENLGSAQTAFCTVRSTVHRPPGVATPATRASLARGGGRCPRHQQRGKVSFPWGKRVRRGGVTGRNKVRTPGERVAQASDQWETCPDLSQPSCPAKWNRSPLGVCRPGRSGTASRRSSGPTPLYGAGGRMFSFSVPPCSRTVRDTFRSHAPHLRFRATLRSPIRNP